MADLKNIDADALVARLAAYAIELKQRLSHEADTIAADLDVAARALAAMPNSASDLIMQSDYVLVGEMCVSSGHYHPGSTLVRAQINVGFNSGELRLESTPLSRDREQPAKQYRVIVALLPLSDVK